MANAFFSDLLSTISERGRTLLRRGGPSVRPPGCLRTARIVRGAAVGPGRSLRHRDGARRARPLPRSRRRRPAGVLRDAGPRFRPRPREAVAGDRELARAAERRRRQRPAFCLRAAAPGADPPAQPRARRHQRTGGDARRPASPDEGQQGPGRARPRRRASVVFLVQQGISRAAQDRLVDASEYSGTDHPLRGGARNPRLERSAPPHRSRSTGAATPSSTRSSPTSR